MGLATVRNNVRSWECLGACFFCDTKWSVHLVYFLVVFPRFAGMSREGCCFFVLIEFSPEHRCKRQNFPQHNLITITFLLPIPGNILHALSSMDRSSPRETFFNPFFCSSYNVSVGKINQWNSAAVRAIRLQTSRLGSPSSRTRTSANSRSC